MFYAQYKTHAIFFNFYIFTFAHNLLLKLAPVSLSHCLSTLRAQNRKVYNFLGSDRIG